jgi:hypothetical protein
MGYSPVETKARMLDSMVRIRMFFLATLETSDDTFIIGAVLSVLWQTEEANNYAWNLF